jgi:predicted nicotinamide N-methyase
LLTFEIANKKIFIESPVDPAEHSKSIDDVIEKYATSDKIPFWIEVWPSAIALAEFILQRGEFTNKKVLDLGCGLGLTSVALGFKNAFVTATDYEVNALQYAKRNYIRNVGSEENAKFVYLDWRHPILYEKFDFVIGADIIYERNLFADIVKVLEMAMDENSVCYLADPNRRIAIEFFEILKSKSFGFENILNREVEYRGSNTIVSIYRIKKK